MPFIREHTHLCHPERKRGISQMLVEHANRSVPIRVFVSSLVVYPTRDDT